MLAFVASHFIEFFFTGQHGEPWYHAAVWGNVVAVVPLGIGGFIGFYFHRWFTQRHEDFDAKEAHNERAREARKILDLLDPHTDGGIREIHEHVETIEDRVDETTPGGIKTILDRLDER